MTNTATLNTSIKNRNNNGKLKYILRRRKEKKKKNYYCLKLRNMQTQQSKTGANLNFLETDRQTDRQTDRDRDRETETAKCKIMLTNKKNATQD